jgi:predicted DCC family thiol-disulfide oxidoreductase YuxK
VLIFDGECGFCTMAARRISAHFNAPATAVSWQQLGPDGLAAVGLTPMQAQQAAWWVGDDGRLSRGHRAVACALLEAGGWRRLLGRLVLAPGISWCAAGVYRIVVRYRQHLPGATQSCRVER